ncbi:threonine aldolase family protein [Kitasatospora aureofaciens]|uniref:Threonine aldolase n=2 Tax=Kitasatospora aureofaciens TaxID=1894 RepID=A0A8H9HFI3_KITAU|nr:GntG family PLP-dependent aldolase [Kitasatospora aureofaciens]ARF81390.1 low specificity L-threonine aldolase [Kitasatospora aureofaciens]GGU54963.1 threonine aldolase [Kitasatospora aureofaciens]
MTDQTIDLRSDTVTRPTAAMRAAMAAAEVGDDTLGDDPTVIRLERMLADAFGFTGALFLPSGVMANQLALRLLVPPGQELLADAGAHFLLYEDGGVAWHGGILTRTTVSDDGLIDPEVLARMIRPATAYGSGTRAVAVENTHNAAGGVVYPLAALREIRRITREAGVAVHCDGARLWNAHVASGVSFEAYGACFDTLSLCVSKGLGAPAGTVLLLDADRLEEARVMRHRMGGSMRQTGILAAAAIYAFEHNIGRMAEDHSNAALIAGLLRDSGLEVREPQTNLVFVEVPDAAKVQELCATAGVRVSVMGPRTVRLVAHLDVDKQQCERAALTVAKAVAQLATSS